MEEGKMFHKLLDLKSLEKEVQKYRDKIENTEIFIPEEWLPENFTIENMREVLRKSIATGKNFEEFMPQEYKEYLKNYMEGLEKELIY